MADVGSAINEAKFLIDVQLENGTPYHSLSFDGYQKGYLLTNENIKAYLDLVSFDGKDKALTVLLSGDHMMSLISKGITNIDTFDINGMQPYLALGLKRAMVLKYSYLEFLEVNNKLNNAFTSIEEITSIIIDLLPFMEIKHASFWKKIIDYNYQVQKGRKEQVNPIVLLTKANESITKQYPYSVSFLESEEQYNALKNSLKNANVNFKAINASNLTKEFPSKYDFILLSNILDYFGPIWGLGWEYDKLKKFEEELSKISKQDGIVFLHYLHNRRLKNQGILFDGSLVMEEDLENEKIFSFGGLLNKEKYEGSILKRMR